MRKALPLTAAAIIAGVGLAACGGQPAAPPTLKQVATQIGATNVQPMSPTLFASQEGNARWQGRSIDLAVFASDQLRDKWIQAASQFGPILTKGHDYAATTG